MPHKAALGVEDLTSGHTSIPFKSGTSLEDIPEYLPGGRCSAGPSVR